MPVNTITSRRRGVSVRERYGRQNGRRVVLVDFPPEADNAEKLQTEPPSGPSSLRQSPPLVATSAERLRLFLCSSSWKFQARTLSGKKAIDSTEFNALAEQAFLCLAEAADGLDVRQFLAASALALNVSPETAKRYLQKHSAIGGTLAVDGGRVCVVRESAAENV